MVCLFIGVSLKKMVPEQGIWIPITADNMVDLPDPDLPDRTAFSFL
jgi:hypothetical protein